MESFRTTIKAIPSPDKITYKTKVLFIGSCFTENIGNRFVNLKMYADVNPFGIIYNPISIYNSLNFLLQNKIFEKHNLHFYNEQWFSFDHHGRFSHNEIEKCLHNINERISTSSQFLQSADFVFITFGTAHVFRHLKTNEVVANCHKLPSVDFDSYMLNVNEIVNSYTDLIQKTQKFNPTIKIIFTLSPVRHWKDGAEKNQLSKATLLLAIHQLKNKFNNIAYFPAYEIMMDDLRDYRFYADDMLHPSLTAVNYIWQIFSEIYFNAETLLVQKDVEKMNRLLQHRPINKDSESYKKFTLQTIATIDRTKTKYPFLNISSSNNLF